MIRTYSSEGFVIGRRKIGEADRILILFTKDFGKISVVAKGVRKLTSRKRGGVEVFNHIKFSASRTQGMDILTEVETLNSQEAVRKDLKKLSVGYYFCEVLDRVTREGERHINIFEIFKKYFGELATSANLKRLRFGFVYDVLVELGFWPIDKKMDNPDLILEGIIERKLSSFRVGKKMLQHN